MYNRNIWRTEGLRERTSDQQFFERAPAHGDLGRNFATDIAPIVFVTKGDLCFNVINEWKRELHEHGLRRPGIIVIKRTHCALVVVTYAVELVRNPIFVVTEDAVLQSRIVERVRVFLGVAIAVLATDSKLRRTALHLKEFT